MRKSFWLVSAGIAAMATPAFAQVEVPPVGEATNVQEGASVDDVVQDEAGEQDTADIIVTATRRNEALSDIPLAVSAITGQALENSGAADIRQLQQLSPSLLVSSTQSEAGASSARIRGIGTVGDNPGLESSVAVFIDGVYRSRNGTALTELGPVERIEVLRGPQGTLFGRNASAGIISVITAGPTFENEGYAQASVGNHDYRRLELGVTGPISDVFAYRLDGVYLKRDGFIEDVISGREVNDRDRYLIRGQFLYEPSDSLSVRVIGDYANRDEECCGAVYLPARDAVSDGSGGVTFEPSSFAPLMRALGGVIIDEPFERQMSITPGRSYRQDVEDYGISAEVVYDFGGAELTSISAYRGNDYIRGQDADFNNLDILYRDDDGGSEQNFRTFTQELRLQGEALEGRLDWLVGGYYAQEELTVTDNLSFGTDYQDYANCVLAATLSGQLSQAFGTPINLTQPVGGVGCFNQQVAGAVATNPLVPEEQRELIALLGGLAPGVPAGGYDAIGAVLGAGLGLPPLSFNNAQTNDRFEQKSRNFAVFTHNIFEVTDRLNVTLGLRYTNEKKTLDATLTDNNLFCQAIAGSPFAALAQLPCVVPAVPGGTFTQEDVDNKEDEFSGTAVVSYKVTDDLLTYASYSRGYKAGGFNLDRSALMRGLGGIGPVLPTAGLENLIFEPEKVDAFEIGAKYNGPGFDLNVAAFHQVFDGFQLNTFNGLFFEVENVNACKDDLGGGDTDDNPATGACTGGTKGGVRSMGVEVETFIRPMENVDVNLGATLVDTEYRNNLVGVDGAPLSPSLFQLPGRRLSNSSLWTLTGAFTYTPPIGNSGLSGLFYVDGRYQSEFNTGSDLDLEKLQGDYFVMNARVGLRGPDDVWGLELWARNLLDEDYQQVAFDMPIQGATGTTIRGVEQGFYPRATQLFGSFLAEPRTYGVTVRTRF
jgi:iron complex outermembrane recepter protein